MSKHPTLDLTVERTIAASPDELYNIITDVTRIGELSPECRNAEWVGKNTGPVVGARFKGQNELGDSKWTTKPTVTEAEPGEVFEFKVPMGFGPTWRYEFHPVPEGTESSSRFAKQSLRHGSSDEPSARPVFMTEPQTSPRACSRRSPTSTGSQPRSTRMGTAACGIP